MSKKCMGCGSIFQTKQKEQVGYVTLEKYDSAIYCERCFRLKHYHERKGSFLSLSNDAILKEAQEYACPIYYFVDLLNCCEESMEWFSNIRGKKTLVLTKIDYIPKFLSLDKLISRIRSVYHISDEIIPVSVKQEKTLHRFWNHINQNPMKHVLFLGMTNVGKSSLLNQLSITESQLVSPILVSEMPNTTQSFLSWKIQDITIYDAPGFNYRKSYEGDFQYASSFKKYLHPITHPMKLETRLKFHSQVLLSQDCKQNYVTFYGSNDFSLEKQYHDESTFSYEETVHLLRFQDLVFPGIGFFQFRNETNVTLKSLIPMNYEIRDSLIGGNYDTN